MDNDHRLHCITSRATVQSILDTAPAAVLHLWEPGIGTSLDEALQVLALEYPGTRFARASAASAAPLLRRLRRPRGAWVAAARSGRVVGLVAAEDGSEGGVDNVAVGGVGGGGGARGGAGDESSDFSDDETEGPNGAGPCWVRDHCLQTKSVQPPAGPAGDVRACCVGALLQQVNVGQQSVHSAAKFVFTSVRGAAVRPARN